MFNLDPGTLGEIILRTVSVYFVLLFGLRIAGKRELGQMTAFDLVVILIISNAVQNAMVGPDVSLTGGITAALTLLVVNRIVNLIAQRVPWLRQEITGSPSLLVHEGALVEENLKREGVTPDEVMQALREHGVDDLQQIKAAVLEVDGTISVISSDATSGRTRRRLRGRKPMG